MNKNKASVIAHGTFTKQEETVRNIAEDNWGNYDTGKYTHQPLSEHTSIRIT